MQFVVHEDRDRKPTTIQNGNEMHAFVISDDVLLHSNAYIEFRFGFRNVGFDTIFGHFFIESRERLTGEERNDA